MKCPSIEASATYIYLNNNKRGITLNLKNDSAKEIFIELIKWADMIVESKPPGFLTSKGIDFETLQKANKRLVMTSVTNFGQRGPYKNYRANEMTLCALGGLFIISGEPDREPLSYMLIAHRLHQYTG
jgi:crotonobetainyl-CoA:carnitine CoA-transferase CaiB-like acyl-CoA transferase